MNNYFYMFLAITGARVISEFFIEKYREYRTAKVRAQVMLQYADALAELKKQYGNAFAEAEALNRQRAQSVRENGN